MNVFISHAPVDRPFAASLAKTLRRGGLNPWYDAELDPGNNWPLEIGKALDQAEAMIVLLSPEAVASDWVRREIEFGISSPRFKDRLIPVLVRRTKDVPWILGELRQWLVADDPSEAGRRILDLLRTRKAPASAKP